MSKEEAYKLESEGRIALSSSGMPMLKRYVAEGRQELWDLLTEISNKKFDRDIDFIREIFPRLIRILDYAEHEVFYEYGGKSKFRADAVFSDSIEARPWVVVEVKGSRAHNIAEWTYRLRRYLIEINCRTGFLISPEFLILLVDDGKERFELESLNLIQAEKIFKALDRSAQDQIFLEAPPQQNRLTDLIEAVEKAQTNAEKGKSLEQLARFLFERVPSLKCKYNNLQTRSSEIDLVMEYDRSKGNLPLFEEFGRFSLIECKNWSKPVGVGPVRDFLGKLDKCKVRLGVIFAKNGVTGVDAGADALREIQSRFDRDGVFVLVFSLEDVRGLENGGAFVAALDKKADSLRFDM